jgi:hypothetical protein
MRLSSLGEAGVLPQQRSLKFLRDAGYIAQVVEQTIRIPARNGQPATIFKRDLFGFADICAIGPVELSKDYCKATNRNLPALFQQEHKACPELGTIYVQTTAGMSNKNARIAKIDACEASRPILGAGNRIELHVWRKMGKRGARKLWELARYDARLHGQGIIWHDISELPLFEETRCEPRPDSAW